MRQLIGLFLLGLIAGINVSVSLGQLSCDSPRAAIEAFQSQNYGMWKVPHAGPEANDINQLDQNGFAADGPQSYVWFGCNAGYRRLGEEDVYCKSANSEAFWDFGDYGKWTECEAICKVPDTFEAFVSVGHNVDIQASSENPYFFNSGDYIKFISCASGYSGSASTTISCTSSGWQFSGGATAFPVCDDIDECADNTDDCAEAATCENTVGSFTCTCNEGYTGNGQVCTDINDCLPNNPCQNGGTCADAGVNLYKCTCAEGYTGENCEEDIDECSIGDGPCDENADCANNPGSYTCTCRNGFTGDGTSCQDIDECTTGDDSCDPNADCTNTPGSYTCTCSNGFTGDGTSCQDIDDCLPNNPCLNGGICEDTGVNSYSCTCAEGYTGVNCADDIDECSIGDGPCDQNADCTNTPGSYTCTCRNGFTGDGTSCQDIDECSIGDGPCDENADCTNTVGSYTCTCRDGFTGDGTSCQDINDCDPNPCQNGGSCTDAGVNAYTCECESGFAGDNCENSVGDSDVLDSCGNVPGFTLKNGRCLLFLDEPGTFESQCKRCSERFGVLATALSQRDAEILADFLRDQRDHPLAYFNQYRIGNGQQTVSGVSQTTFQWGSSSASSIFTGNSDDVCGVVTTSDQFQGRCCFERLPAICELNACLGGYEMVNGRCYKVIPSHSFWETNQRVCKEDGTNLVSVNDDAEVVHVVEYLRERNLQKRLQSIWVGCHDLLTEGRYQDLNGNEIAALNGLLGRDDHKDCCSLNLLNGDGLKSVVDKCCYDALPAVCAHPAFRFRPRGDCREGYIQVGRGCVKVVRTRGTFESAQRICKKDGGNLLSSTVNDNSNDNNVALRAVAEYINESYLLHHIFGNVWFGCHDQFVEGELRDLEGRKVKYLNAKPHNDGHRDCCSINLHAHNVDINNVELRCCHNFLSAICWRPRGQ